MDIQKYATARHRIIHLLAVLHEVGAAREFLVDLSSKMAFGERLSSSYAVGPAMGKVDVRFFTPMVTR